MTIGEALKETRKSLGLSQTEMADPVLTKSYYSKIERGIHEIKAIDLIKILEMHNVDISEFLAKCGVKEKTGNTVAWMNELRQSFYRQDIEKIKLLEEKITNLSTMDKFNKDKLYATALLLEAGIEQRTNKFPKNKRKRIKNLIFGTDSWNEDNLRLFALSLSFWSVSEVNIIIKSILKKYANIKNFSKETQILVCAVMVNYMFYLIRHSIQDIKLVAPAFKLVNNLPVEPETCFAKIMKNYYLAWFNKDIEEQNNILNFFEKNNMKEIVDAIKVSI